MPKHKVNIYHIFEKFLPTRLLGPTCFLNFKIISHVQCYSDPILIKHLRVRFWTQRIYLSSKNVSLLKGVFSKPFGNLLETFWKVDSINPPKFKFVQSGSNFAVYWKINKYLLIGTKNWGNCQVSRRFGKYVCTPFLSEPKDQQFFLAFFSYLYVIKLRPQKRQNRTCLR